MPALPRRSVPLLSCWSVLLAGTLLTACVATQNEPVKDDKQAMQDAKADAKKDGAGEAVAKQDAKAKPAGEKPAADDAHKKAKDKPPIYDEKADFQAEIDRALASAAKDNKRVMLMFGGNWCSWCHKLHELFEADKPIRETLANDYILVMVDSHNGEAVAKKYDTPLDKGVPFLTVLDAKGAVLTKQETGSLEEGPTHDPAKVLAFLQKWRVPNA